MTIAEQLKYARAQLEAWARTRKGTAVIANDLVDYFSILQTPAGGARAVVLFHAENKRGEYEEAGMVDRVFWVGISRGLSLKLNTADALVEGDAAGPSLADLLDEARQVVRAMSFDADTTEVTPDYKGMQPYQVDGWLLDAKTLEFWIGTQLPAVE